MKLGTKKELWLWVTIMLLMLLPATLIWMRFQAGASFVARSQDAGHALMYRAGLYPDIAYAERSDIKPKKMDWVEYLSDYRGYGRYYVHTNLLAHNPTNRLGISVIIEERPSEAPGPFFLRPLLPVTGWKPRRLAIYNDGHMSGLVPREFQALDLSEFVSSDTLLKSPAN